VYLLSKRRKGRRGKIGDVVLPAGLKERKGVVKKGISSESLTRIAWFRQ